MAYYSLAFNFASQQEWDNAFVAQVVAARFESQGRSLDETYGTWIFSGLQIPFPYDNTTQPAPDACDLTDYKVDVGQPQIIIGVWCRWGLSRIVLPIEIHTHDQC